MSIPASVFQFQILSYLEARFTGYVKCKPKYILDTTSDSNHMKRDGVKTKDGVVVSTLAADIQV